VLVPGTCFPCRLAFWPGAVPLRALMQNQRGEIRTLEGPLPERWDIAAFLTGFAHLLARQPWLERGLCALAEVVPVLENDVWYVTDRSGAALPLAGSSHWVLHALAGGLPLDLYGEWDGRRLTALGAMVSGRFHALARELP